MSSSSVCSRTRMNWWSSWRPHFCLLRRKSDKERQRGSERAKKPQIQEILTTTLSWSHTEALRPDTHLTGEYLSVLFFVQIILWFSKANFKNFNRYYLMELSGTHLIHSIGKHLKQFSVTMVTATGGPDLCSRHIDCVSMCSALGENFSNLFKKAELFSFLCVSKK